MTRSTLSFAVVAAALSITGLAAAQDMRGMAMHDHHAPATQPTSQPSAEAVDLKNNVCPVTGDPVGDSKLTATHDGKTYHFCCADCPPAFAKDPAKYAKAVAADPAKYGVKK